MFLNNLEVLTNFYMKFKNWSNTYLHPLLYSKPGEIFMTTPIRELQRRSHVKLPSFVFTTSFKSSKLDRASELLLQSISVW